MENSQVKPKGSYRDVLLGRKSMPSPQSPKTTEPSLHVAKWVYFQEEVCSFLFVSS